MQGATTVGPGVVCGPYPSREADIQHLSQHFAVTCIVNTCTAEERARRHKYEQWLAKHHMIMVFVPWTGGTTLTKKPKELVASYKKFLADVHKETADADCVYLHGIEEDGIAAMGLLLLRGEQIRDPIAHLQDEDRLAHLIDNDAEKKETLTLLFSALGTKGTLRQYFPKAPRTSEGFNE